ncbi:MAG: hypothetical protein KJO00_11570 [Bacteroidia bacterium]|nr:hypothetical protein [Bacteroidia bacterium]MBT8270270.1 hypothetical protein [Bacteroidia bacterium]MBT8288652.1 hypothetical protein [Bacteroidia bacterium]NNF81971.1 hypothetical protein [Flavobacteriaceae bacterium]NNL79779.1 hypothetical protein [Flavobacteriaceae bacterium]
MAQDLRKLFENEQKMSSGRMPEGHEGRFMERLDNQLPVASKKASFGWLRIAASVVIFIGLGYLAFRTLGPDPVNPNQEIVTATSIEDISPELKKVEDYYLANINLELSKLQYSPENKELFDGYVKRLGELSQEYERLSAELIQSGPNEKTVSALIDNLKFRLNMLYRLKEKLNELNNDISIEENQG